MIRKAQAADAEQLFALNEEFNGKGGATPESIRTSLLANPQEIVIVADTGGVLAGFVCVQLKRSFCYDEYMPEITEVYVRPEYRRKGVARAMLAFAEEACAAGRRVPRFELLTGTDNVAAQALYRALGYREDGEIHLSKGLDS